MSCVFSIWIFFVFFSYCCGFGVGHVLVVLHVPVVNFASRCVVVCGNGVCFVRHVFVVRSVTYNHQFISLTYKVTDVFVDNVNRTFAYVV